MNIEELRAYCLDKDSVTESFPFNDDVIVFKVAEKIFALSSLKKWEENTPAVNLKCEHNRAIVLREEYEDIQAGFHMNKKHWNTVYINNFLSDEFIKEMIDHSYKIVVNLLPKKIKTQILYDRTNR